MKDLIILGAGPAGLTAGIYAARYGLSCLIIGKEIGGMANYAEILENYPGFDGSGFQLMQTMSKQVKKFGVEILNEEIVKAEKKGDKFIVKTKKQEFESKALILALGTEHNKLKIPGEQKFIGKGVSFCSTCDAPLYKNKTVAVIGGSDSALATTLILSKHASKVLLLYRGKELRGEKINIDRIKKEKKIEVICCSIPLEIKGNDFVSSIVVEENGKKKEHFVQGIFIEAGKVPSTIIAQQLNVKLDDKGYIIVDSEMKTNIEGVYAAGDCTKGRLKQIVVAAAQGAIAVKSAYDFLSLGLS